MSGASTSLSLFTFVPVLNRFDQTGLRVWGVGGEVSNRQLGKSLESNLLSEYRNKCYIFREIYSFETLFVGKRRLRITSVISWVYRARPCFRHRDVFLHRLILEAIRTDR